MWRFTGWMVVAVAAAVMVATAEGAAGKVVVFNDNGAWCWYQDPRVVHDAANDTLLIASVACSDGAGGKSRGGDVDLVS